MPIPYSESFYYNRELLEAEEKVLDRFSKIPLPMSKEELRTLTGLSDRNLERVLAAIRRYSGYSVARTRRNGETKFQVIYTPIHDRWAYLLYA